MNWIRRSAVGRGSSATVFLATASSGDVFAVKSAVITQSDFLQKEQRILSSLSHPSVVGYRGLDLTRESGVVMYNLFMEYVTGGTLSDEIVRRGGRIKEAAAGFYTRQIVRGLEYLHARGLVHCDIKATNILVGENGVKIADFGCSKWVSEPAAIGGTPMFMAPEVARGEEQGISSDIWALGCTLIEMVTGGPPWPDAGNPVSLLHRIGYSGKSPEIPSFLSDPAKDFLGKCLRKDPRERWSAIQLLGHPFLVELSSGSEELKESHSDSHSNSPTSILDQRLWNSVEEEPESAVLKSEKWDDDRIRRLSMISGEIRWELEDENWITIRGCERGESNRSSVEDYFRVNIRNGFWGVLSIVR